MQSVRINGSEVDTEHNYRVSLNAEDERLQPLLLMDGVSITQVAGTIDCDEKARLKRLLFRATRGKALPYFQDIPLRAN
jgi:hypothetical protein